LRTLNTLFGAVRSQNPKRGREVAVWIVWDSSKWTVVWIAIVVIDLILNVGLEMFG
jgi:hypothetical protein